MSEPSSLSMAVAGPATWDKLRDDVKSLPCPTCVEHGLLGLDGWQDVVNVNQLNRPLHNPARFVQYKAEVEKAAEKAGISSPAIGSTRLNSRTESKPSENKMGKGELVPVFAGELLGYGVSVGIDHVPATAIPIPGVGPKTLLNAVAAGVFTFIGYHQSNRRPMVSTLAYAAGAYHTTKVIDLFRTGAAPTAFLRAAPLSPVISPSSPAIYGGAGGSGNISVTSYQPAGPAIF